MSLKKKKKQLVAAALAALMTVSATMPALVAAAPVAFAEEKQENTQLVRNISAEQIWDGTIAESYAGGDGTSQKPYQIATAQQLARVASQINSGAEKDKYYKLTGDIYLNDTSSISTWDTIVPQNTWNPIGSSSTPFSGTFDGAGHSVYGLYISTNKDYQGVFGSIGTSPIKNLKVAESYIQAGNYAGGICGYSIGELTNCHNKATVIGKDYVGGIAGYTKNPGGLFGGGAVNINDCSNEGKITGTNYVGGMLGNGETACMDRCFNVGDISGEEYIGGLAGRAVESHNSWNIGKVTGSSYVGGIFGEGINFGSSSPEISTCFNAGVISGESYIGGILGHSTVYSGFYPSNISDCYNIGDITGTGDYIGGIEGKGELCRYTNCYNAGKCSFNSSNLNVNAFANYQMRNDSKNNYFLAGCCGEKDKNGWWCVSSATSAEMCEDAFVTKLNNGGSAWIKDTDSVNRGYPILKGIDYTTLADIYDETIPSMEEFDVNIYRANKLIDDSLVIRDELNYFVNTKTPCGIFIEEAQKSGLPGWITAWKALTSLFDTIDNLSNLGDIVMEEKDLYSAIILNLLEVSETRGLIDCCQSKIKEVKSWASELKLILKTKYDIDVTTMDSFNSMSLEQKKITQKLTKEYFESKYSGLVGLNKVLDKCGTFLDIADNVETWLEYCGTAVSLVEMGDSLKTVVRTMYQKCPDTNLNLKAALWDCVDIMDSSIEELQIKVYNRAWTIAGEEISKKLIDELWKDVKKACNAGFPVLDILMAGYKTGKFISNTLFNTDNISSQYCEMLALSDVKNLIDETYQLLEDQFQTDKTAKNAAAYLSAIDVLAATRDQDCVEAYNFVDVLDDILVNKIGALFDKTGANKRQEIKKSINSIQGSYTQTYEVALLTGWIHYLDKDYPNAGLENQYSYLLAESLKRIWNKKYVITNSTPSSGGGTMGGRSVLAAKTGIPDVDLRVYDKDNNLVAYIEDNNPVCTGNLTVVVEGDTKTLYFYNDEEYRIEYVGKDTGAMDVKITEYDENENELRDVYFYDVALTDGKTYESNVDGKTLGDVSYSLSQGKNQSIQPDLDTYQAKNSKNNVKMVSSTLIKNGELFFQTDAYPDEQFDIYAYVPEGYKFIGWTSNLGADIFADSNSYSTTVRMPNTDVTIKAVLSKNNVVKKSVETPMITPNGGTFSGTQTVSIMCGTDDAEIYYTTDGTTPSNTSTKYTGPFSLAFSSTVKAIGIKDGLEDSLIVSANFTRKSNNTSTSNHHSNYGNSGTLTPNHPSEPNPTNPVKLDTSTVTITNGGNYTFLVKGNNDTSNMKVEVVDPNVASVSIDDAKDPRGARYRVTAKAVGTTEIKVTYQGQTSSMKVNVQSPKGSITLDTANYIFAPGNQYEIGAFLKNESGNSLSAEQVKAMITDGKLKVRDSRTGSIVDLEQLANGNFRVTGKQEGTAYIIYEVGGTHASVRIDVQKGTKQHGTAVRNVSYFIQ